jgi:hypothetical protein
VVAAVVDIMAVVWPVLGLAVAVAQVFLRVQGQLRQEVVLLPVIVVIQIELVLDRAHPREVLVKTPNLRLLG